MRVFFETLNTMNSGQLDKEYEFFISNYSNKMSRNIQLTKANSKKGRIKPDTNSGLIK